MADLSANRLGRRSKGLTHELVEALEEQLATRAIKPGDKLPSESHIMEVFGVSRGVVREALSRLQAAGLVQTHHGIGTFALEPDSDARFRLESPTVADHADMMNILELRTSLESGAAGLAATRRTDEQLRAMRQALDEFENHVSTVSETVAPDYQFHLAIALATGNPYFGELMSQLGVAVIPRTRVSAAALEPARRQQRLQKVHQEHRDIYDAIARQDPESARAAMRVHLVNSRERQIHAHEAAAPDPMEKMTQAIER